MYMFKLESDQNDRIVCIHKPWAVLTIYIHSDVVNWKFFEERKQCAEWVTITILSVVVF